MFTLPPPYVVFPALTAFLYAVAAILLKRALHPSSGPWRTVFIANWVTGLLFLPLLLFLDEPVVLAHCFIVLIPAAAFFAGQIFTFIALNRGDVSVATPVLGSKVLLVAALSLVLTEDDVQRTWWLAALMTLCATVLLAGGKHEGTRRRLWISIGYGLAAAGSFALTDVLVQRLGSAVPRMLLLPLMFLGVALFSLSVIPQFEGSLLELPRSIWPWLLAGSALLGLQSVLMAYALASYGNATVINVVYSSRGLWSVVLVWAIGHWFGNTEREQGTRVMTRRALGSLLLIGAILLVI